MLNAQCFALFGRTQSNSLVNYSFDIMRFRILDATVWNLKLTGSESSNLIGQAATFAEWEIL